jgi:hypothetical protein
MTAYKGVRNFNLCSFSDDDDDDDNLQLGCHPLAVFFFTYMQSIILLPNLLREGYMRSV